VSFLLNDRSFHGQFATLELFYAAMRAVMRIRRTALAEGHELECHRSVGGRAVTPAHDLFEAVRACAERDQRVAVLQWLSGRGPFWDDAREHSADRWYEALGDVVTDSAVAEAAERIRNGRATDLVSASPSDWLSTPLVVEEVDGAGSRIPTPVENHWTTSTVEARARELRGPIGSWADLEARCRRVSRLVFADDSFAPLGSEPFHRGLAEEILTRVETLGRLTACLTRDGQLSAAGLALQQQFCVGDKAWFTDSSAGEKIDFKDDLTFRDPLRPGERLFCTWHGKVKNRQIRIHYSWPVPAGEVVRVVYVGPKITKR
jgi:hypothetical protein